MSISHQKVKSVAKIVIPRGEKLQSLIDSTLKLCSDIVGSTLGPGGMSVVIERQETGLAPVVTKDGVTVFKSLGFSDPVQQVLMETAREASIRTAAEAGDGTTTATILQEALTSNIRKVTKEYPHVSPQMVAREMDKLFEDRVQPYLKDWALPCDLGENRKRCWDVARISANGDAPLADAVMQCYDVVGDLGNVTITEASGKSEYEVKQIEGFHVGIGYEESCGTFWPEFINDKATSSCTLKRPLWLLYNGTIRDFNEIFLLATEIAEAAGQKPPLCEPSLVVVANGFSESFVATCAASFGTRGAIRIFPLLAPRSIQKTAQLDFLHDIAALTGAKVFDPLTSPIDTVAGLKDLGNRAGPTLFESGRFRSVVSGRADEDLVLERVDLLMRQMENQSGGEYDKNVLNERIAKLTSGIARLTVRGASNGEVKEKRDRAEDAVCAVRSAIKYGALPGGGTIWIALANRLSRLQFEDTLTNIVARKILAPSLRAVVARLFSNAGFNEAQCDKMIAEMDDGQAYDLQRGATKVDPIAVGLLDSFSAVRDSLKNAISVSNNMGTCGGVVVFGRDAELERREAIEAMEYMKAAGSNEANDRG
jgi:chaperonin GroEL